MVLPDWIPLDAWNGYIEMRQSIKKPLKTQRAITLAINTLARLQEAGDDPGAVLDQSTMKSWIGLFALPKERRESSRQIEGRLGIKGQATANNAHSWLEESC